MSQSGSQPVISGRVSKKSAASKSGLQPTTKSGSQPTTKPAPKSSVPASKSSTKTAPSLSRVKEIASSSQASQASQAKTPKRKRTIPSQIQPIHSQIPPTPSRTHRRQRRHISMSEDGEEESEGDTEDAGKRRRTSDTTVTTVGDDVDEELDLIDQEEQDLTDTEAEPGVQKSRGKKQSKKEQELVNQRQSNLSKDVKGCFINLETTCRILYLCDFDLPVARIIKAVWGDNIQQSDWEWAESNNRIGWNASNWKKRSVLNMERRIRDYLRNDKENTLASITEYKPMAAYFASKYSPSSFTDVFDFIDGCVDVAESAKAYKECEIFFKTIYANFGTRVKLYMDWVADPERLFESPWSRRNLLLWINRMADSDRFHVEPSMLVRLEDKKRGRPVHMSNAPPAPDQDRDYVFFDGDDDENGENKAGDTDTEDENAGGREEEKDA